MVKDITSSEGRGGGIINYWGTGKDIRHYSFSVMAETQLKLD